MRCSPWSWISLTTKSAMPRAGAASSAGGAAGSAGVAAAGARSWAEHTTDPAHRARVITNPNRFMNSLPARVLLKVCVECRCAWRCEDRLRINGPRQTVTGAAELLGQLTRFGICLQDIFETA